MGVLRATWFFQGRHGVGLVDEASLDSGLDIGGVGLFSGPKEKGRRGGGPTFGGAAATAGARGVRATARHAEVATAMAGDPACEAGRETSL